MKNLINTFKFEKTWRDKMGLDLPDTAQAIFDDLDAKMYSSGVYKKINVRSYSLIRKKYGVLPYTKKHEKLHRSV